MARKTTTKPTHDDPEQSKRFIDTARAIGADETEEGAEQVFKNVVTPKRSTRATRTPDDS